MMRSLPFFLWLLLSLWVKYAIAQNEYTINYTAQDGLPSNNVYAIAQDNRGYIWLGTDAGLSRYDGYEFRNYGLEDGLPDVEVLKFFKDSQGRIWMFTLNGNAGYIENDSIYSSVNRPELKALDARSRINAIFEQDGKIYFSAIYEGLKAFDLNTKETQTFTVDGLINSQLCQCNDKFYWFINTNQGPKRDSPENDKLKYVFETLPESIQEAEASPVSIDFYKLGFGYFNCYEQEILTYTTRVGTNHLKLMNTITSELSYSPSFEQDEIRIHDVHVINDKTIILYTTNGIYHYLPTKNELVRTHDFEQSTSSIIDHEGNLWVSSLTRGLFFQPQNSIKKLGEQIVQASMMLLFDDDLLVLHDKRFISRVKPNFEVEPAFEFHKPLYFKYFINHGDTLLVGEWDFLFLIDGSRMQPILSPRYSNRAVTIDDSRLTIANKRNQITQYDLSLQEERITQADFLINYMLRLNQDSTLIASDDGIYLFAQDSISSYINRADLQVRINRLAYHLDRLWISTSGQGLKSYVPTTGKVFDHSDADELNATIAKEILPVENGLWVSQNNGLNHLEYLGNDSFNVKTISDIEGLNASQINDLERFQNHIILAQDDGLYYFPEDRSFDERPDFPLFIEEVWGSNGSLLIRENDQVAHETESISITFKALEYRNKKGLEYQYRIFKLPKETPPWTSSRANTVNYSNLGPGTYRFQVRAKTYNSDWTPSREFTFSIQYAYWETLTFQILTGLAAILLIGLIIYRINRSSAHQRKLESDRIVAEIKALKAQINPHFLFNALNSIQSFLLSNENERAEEYLVKYSKLMRRILDHSSLLSIPLQDELETIKLYVDLEKYRMGNNFDFNIQIDQAVDQHTKIPSMIFQPIVENAIWHGVSHMNGGIIRIKISHPEEHALLIIIEDNGRGFDPSQTKKSSKGSGLVEGRLSLLNQLEGIKSKLSLKTEPGKGTVVSILVSSKTK